MYIAKDVKYIGVNDHQIDLFEGQYRVPNGMSYNSYVILDDKIAVLDSVDANFDKEWLENIHRAVGNRNPDYFIVQHMEPDHSANIANFMREYANTTIVASARAFVMMKQFFGTDYPERKLVVGEGDTLSLGKHKLKFFMAPMVHWPEVMVTYDSREKLLFSADAFGKFGALDVEEEWVCEARRYYFGIVAKYGVQVQALLKKLDSLELAKICPLHGPILEKTLENYLNLYRIWSSYVPEEEGIVIAYTSIYGNTRKAVQALQEELNALGYQKVVLNDLARCDLAEAVEDAFRYSKLVLATTTYNGTLFPFMREFLNHLTERGYSNRQVAFMENGSWAPVAVKHMKKMLENGKNLTFADTVVRMMSALNEEGREQVKKLARELCEKSKACEEK